MDWRRRGMNCAQEQDGRPNMLIAQITDLHIGFDRGNSHELNVRRLNLVIDELNERSPRPELLIISGDLVENYDDVDAYQHAHALVGRWQGPKIWMVGNHDGRDNFKAELPDVPTDPNGFVQYEVEHSGLRWIILDTLDEGRHGGMICDKRAWWLAERLEEKQDIPPVIILHHPPVDTGIEWMSALPDEQWVRRLEAIVRPARQVICLIAGHGHPPIPPSFAGKPLIVAPSTAPQVALDLDAVDPQHPDGRGLIIAHAPGSALHCWAG